MAYLNWNASAIFQTHSILLEVKRELHLKKTLKSVIGMHIIVCFPRMKHQKKLSLEIHMSVTGQVLWKQTKKWSTACQIFIRFD